MNELQCPVVGLKGFGLSFKALATKITCLRDLLHSRLQLPPTRTVPRESIDIVTSSTNFMPNHSLIHLIHHAT